jgi:hypothetical protein
MTDIIDSLRQTHFIPFFNLAHKLIPMHPIEITKLNEIAGKLNRYERMAVGDQRAGWPFSAIAGAGEVWAGEFLVGIGLGLGIFFGFGEVSRIVAEDVAFIIGLKGRLSTISM